MILFNCDIEDNDNDEIEIPKNPEIVYRDVWGTQMPNFTKNKSRKQQKPKNINIDEDDEANKKIHIINKYSHGISLAEAILINNIADFIQLDKNNDKKPILSKKISLGYIDIEPPERTEYLSKEYSFESYEEVNHFINLAKQETLDSLFQKVRSILQKYIDMDNNFINILTADIIFTYFQDKLGMTHYLLIVGDNNTGKSNILLVFSYLGYRAIYDTAITPANIYNFGSQLEEGQCIIIEDEIGDIDEQFEKKKMYQVSYTSGKKVTRMYDSNNNITGNTKRKSTRQQGFFVFCLKVFASEKMPDKVKSKGFLERVIPLKAVPGYPEFDISEVVNDAGDKEFKELYQELLDTRKLLLMYRMLHYNEPIPNIKLNIKNRYKQLTKPLIRLFQNTKAVDNIIKSLSKYLIEKNEEKIDSLDSSLLTLVINMVSKHGSTLYNEDIWNEIKCTYPNGEIKDKPYSWFVEGYSSVSKSKITNICETKFGAKQHRDKTKGRGLIFNQDTLNKLVENYSIIKEIKIIKQEKNDSISTATIGSGDRDDTYDTSRIGVEENNDNNSRINTVKTHNFKHIYEENILENENLESKNSENSDKNNDLHLHKLSSPSTPSPQPKNSIHRIHPRSDIYECENCTLKGDKWFMLKHYCKYNKTKSSESGPN